MPFADLLPGPIVILLGMAMLVIAFVLRRSGVKRAKISAKRDVASEVRQQFDTAEKAGRTQFERFELRLHEYGREVDAMAETRIATLRRLLLEADETIARLQAILPADESAADCGDGGESNAAA